jgi:hypothetical protein
MAQIARNGNINFEKDPLGGGSNLSCAIEIFYAYLREQLFNGLDGALSNAINESLENRRKSITLHPLILLSSYALENLIKACVWEILLLKKSKVDELEKIKKIANSHRMPEMLDFIEKEWEIVAPPNVRSYINTLKEKVSWRAKYPHSLAGIQGYEIIFVWGQDVANDIRDVWNFLWNEIAARSYQAHIMFFEEKRYDQSPYEYFAEIMRKDFTRLTGLYY